MIFIKKDFLKFIVSIAVCLFAGLIGSLFTRMSINTWYQSLIKPWFAPPDKIFAPVWFVLYLLMGVSFFLVWRKSKSPKFKMALYSFLAQLFFNVLWSIVFFGLQSIFGGLIVIIFLWVTIILMILNYYEISRAASLLQIAYLLWVTFATALNFAIYLLNL